MADHSHLGLPASIFSPPFHRLGGLLIDPRLMSSNGRASAVRTTPFGVGKNRTPPPTGGEREGASPPSVGPPPTSPPTHQVDPAPSSCYSAWHLPPALLLYQHRADPGRRPAAARWKFHTRAHTQERDKGSEDSTHTHLKITRATRHESSERTTGRSVCGPTARKGGREVDGWIGASSSSPTLLSSS